MKLRHLGLPPVFAALLATATAAPVDITTAELPANNTASTFTTTDTKVTINCWADAAQTIPANFGNSGGTYFGIFGGVNNNGIDSSPTVGENMEITFAADAGLSAIEFGFASPQGVTTISGFTENPGAVFNPGGNELETGFAVYDAGTGTVTIDLNYFGGITSTVSFLNPAASAGQTLTIARTNDGAGRQTPLARITYDDVVDTTVGIVGFESFLPTNTIDTFATADGKLTIKGWANAASTTPANFGAAGRFWGVVGNNDNSVDLAESVTIEVAPDATVTDIVVMWPGASNDFEITGFVSDPGASLNANGTPTETGTVSYSGGVVTVDTTSFSAYQRTVSFSNLTDIAGQTLTIRRVGGVGQVSLNYIAYLDTVPPVAPSIASVTVDPAGPVVGVATTMTATLTESAFPAPTYLWEYDNGGGFSPAPGDNTLSTYSFTGGPATDGTYRVTVTNSEGSDSSTLVLTAVDDSDGIDNQWEFDNFGDYLLYDENDDVDTVEGTLGSTPAPDGRNNFQEWTDGTNPLNPDSDGDGLNDGDEVTEGTNPLVIDSDGDGFGDGYELSIAVPATDPTDPGSTPGVDDGRNSIGFNFDTTNNQNPNNTLGPDMFAGAPGLSQKNWNSTGALAGSTTFIGEFDVLTPSAGELVDSSGNSTTTILDINCSGLFSIANNPQIPYGKLYSAYAFDSNDAPLLTINIEDVPYTRYDVVIYPMGFTGNTRGYLKHDASGLEYAVRTAAPVNDGAEPVWYQSSDQSNRSSSTFENYPQTTHVIFRGLSGNSSFTLERVLDNIGIAAIQIVEDLDSDGDGMGDNYELSVGLDPNDNGSTNPLQAPGADFDNDTISNIDEHNVGTNPTSDDTDNDGYLDQHETDTGVFVSLTDTGTDPRIADFDGDGVLDGAETNTGVFVDANDTGANPFVANNDTDQDGWSDAYENGAGSTDSLNPNDPGGPNPAGFAIAFNAANGTTAGAAATNFLANTHAGAPGVEMKNWNRTADLGFGALAGTIADYGGSIVDSSGSVIGDGSSGVDVSFTAGGGAYSSNPDTTSPYGRLFNSFIFGQSASATNSTVTLTGIPYATYDVYVYFGSESNGRFGTITSTSAATTYSFTTGVNNTNPGAYTQTTDTGSGNPVANYAVFSGQSGGTFDVAVEVGAAQNSMGIYGVQVVDTSGGLSPYEAWAAANISDAGQRLATDDADNDGTENLGEYAFFTDPDDASSFPELTTAVTGGNLTLTYDRAKAASGITYSAEWSTNLSNWFTAGVTDTPTGTETADIVEHVASIAQGVDDAKFLRIRVTEP